MKVAISVGHNPVRRGASFAGRTEYGLMASVAGFVIKGLTMLGHEAWLIGSANLDSKIASVNMQDFDLAIELHGNAGGGSGSETLYHPKSKLGKECAEIIQYEFEHGVGFRNRGAKEAWFQGEENGKLLAWCNKTLTTALIIEPAFVDDLDDLRLLDLHADAIGGTIALAVHKCESILTRKSDD